MAYFHEIGPDEVAHVEGGVMPVLDDRGNIIRTCTEPGDPLS